MIPFQTMYCRNDYMLGNSTGGIDCLSLISFRYGEENSNSPLFTVLFVSHVQLTRLHHGSHKFEKLHRQQRT